jgi:calcineurin-like phosphoesterase family protein
MKLLTADTHLDSNPDNDYRWMVFDYIQAIVASHSVDEVFILGDFVDRKDHHSASFVNRIISSLVTLSEKVAVIILKGNHDSPLRGPAYWEFFNTAGFDVHYIVEPTVWGKNLLLLPFTPNPKVDWQGLRLRQFDALFMHVTYPGALSESGFELEGSKLPVLPSDVKIYSGDVHQPQQIRNFIHIGAPLPIKFGDKYPCRMLLLNDSFDIAEEIILSPPRKLMVDISSIDDLLKIRVRKGDQVKLRVTCGPSEIGGFGEFEYEVARWASEKGITVAGTEVIVNSELNRDVDVNQTPEMILKQFAEHEGLAEDMVETGLGLLRETM